MRKNLLLLFIASILWISPHTVSASTLGTERFATILIAPNIQTDTERIAALEQQVAEAKGSADNSWMLTSSALVLLMTGPGLALFYGGLVRKKNVLATMMQSFAMMCLGHNHVGSIWIQPGIRSGESFYRRIKHLFLRGVGGDPNSNYAATIPHQTFMIYQLMFAIITPALITGAFAERMKFKAMYCSWPYGRWWCTARWRTWCGRRRIVERGSRWPLPHAGFCGGTVVHITSGVSALVCALYLGKRLGYPRESVPPHRWS